MSRRNIDSKSRLLPTDRRMKREAGVSLVELLVSLAIGGVLIFGAMKAYVDSRRAYAIDETIVRMQETARYALSVMEPDLRMANYWGLLKGWSRSPVRRTQAMLSLCQVAMLQKCAARTSRRISRAASKERMIRCGRLRSEERPSDAACRHDHDPARVYRAEQCGRGSRAVADLLDAHDRRAGGEPLRFGNPCCGIRDSFHCTDQRSGRPPLLCRAGLGPTHRECPRSGARC